MADRNVHRWSGLSIHLGIALLCFGSSLLTYQWFMTNSPRLESYFYPVVVDWQAEGWARDGDGRWSVEVFGNKVRAECSFVENQNPTALISTQLSPAGREVPLTFLDDDSPDSNRPIGEQFFGRWQPNSLTLREGDRVTFAIRHQCHAGQPTVSTIGPMIIGQKYPKS